MNAAPVVQTGKQLSARERLELNLSQLDNLPTLPAVAVRLLTVMASDNTSTRDVVSLIESDASLTASLLKLARKAEFSIPRKALSVPRVVSLLGFNTVRNLVLCVQLFETFEDADRSRRAANTRKGLWQHAFATACVAQMLAERAGDGEFAAHAFVCGLLHDIGKVAFDKLLGSEWMRVLLRAEKDEYPLHELETEEFGASHATAGGWLAERWHLPERIAQAVARHHEVTTGHGENCLVPLVQLSNAIVKDEDIGHSGNPAKISIVPLDYEPIWPPQLKVPNEGTVSDLRAKVKEQSRAISAALNYASGGPIPPSRR